MTLFQHELIQPTVSVIIPTYNRAQYLCEAVESVINQTFQDWELIVVDDGSTDNTKAVIEPYSESIRYIYQDNRGIAFARNAGIRIAEGQYIAFLDSDDIWLPTKLELQLPLFREHPEIAMAHSDYGYIDENGNILKTHSKKAYPPIDEASNYVFVHLLLNCYIRTDTVMVTKRALFDVGLFDPSFSTGEDYDLWLRISANHRIAYLPKVLSFYRLHGSNITTTCFLSDPPGEIKAIEKAIDMFPAKAANLSAYRLRERRSEIYFSTGFAAFYAGEYGSARFHFLRAFLEIPFSTKSILYLAISLFLPGITSLVIQSFKSHSLSRQLRHLSRRLSSYLFWPFTGG